MSAGLSTAAIVGIGGALAGGVAGAMGKKNSFDNQSGIDLSPASQQEQGYFNTVGTQFSQLQGLMNNGPGGSDVTAATGASRSLADMLGQYAKTGGLPSQGDINTSNDLASKLFAGQQTALNQSFTTQNQQANQLAARLGRSVDDPILQAKMRTGFMNQQAMLDANKGGWATQFSLGMPGQKLGYASQQADVLGNLASQAMQNRTALLNLGSSLGNQERNFRLATGTKWSNGNQQQGGGLGDALTGAMGGLGSGLDMAGKIGGMFGGSGGSAGAGTGYGPEAAGTGFMTGAGNAMSNIFNSMPSRGIGSFSSYGPDATGAGFSSGAGMGLQNVLGSQVMQNQPGTFFGNYVQRGASGGW